MNRSELVFVFDNSSRSSSVSLEHLDLVGFFAPPMALTTTAIRLEVTLDPPSVSDAAASWMIVCEQNKEIFEAAVTSSGPCATIFSQPLLSLKRVRLFAVNAAAAAVTQTTQQVVARVRKLP